MPIPDEFKKMCWKLNQEEPKQFDSFEGLIDFLTAGFTPAELSSIKTYIQELLHRNYDDAHLMKIWRQAGADLVVSSDEEGAIAAFFDAISSSIDERQAAPTANVKQ